jgi:hypothetical protein
MHQKTQPRVLFRHFLVVRLRPKPKGGQPHSPIPHCDTLHGFLTRFAILIVTLLWQLLITLVTPPSMNGSFPIPSESLILLLFGFASHLFQLSYPYFALIICLICFCLTSITSLLGISTRFRFFTLGFSSLVSLCVYKNHRPAITTWISSCLHYVFSHCHLFHSRLLSLLAPVIFIWIAHIIGHCSAANCR